MSENSQLVGMTCSLWDFISSKYVDQLSALNEANRSFLTAKSGETHFFCLEEVAWICKASLHVTPWVGNVRTFLQLMLTFTVEETALCSTICEIDGT